MKTRILIVVVSMIAGQVASGMNRVSPPNGMGNYSGEYGISLSKLSPVTPSQATFEESPAVPDENFILKIAAPETPLEATFEDVAPEQQLSKDSCTTPPDDDSNTVKNSNEKSVQGNFPPPCNIKFGCSL